MVSTLHNVMFIQKLKCYLPHTTVYIACETYCQTNLEITSQFFICCRDDISICSQYLCVVTFPVILPGSDESRPGPSAEDLSGDWHLGHIFLQVGPQVVLLGGIVDQDDLLYKVSGRHVDDGMNCSEESGPRFVVKDYHHARRWQQVRVRLGLAC